MSSVLERFLRYVRMDTQSDETSSSSPSTAKQLDLCRLLEQECRELNLADISMSDVGTVLATIPSNVDHDTPTIALVAHVDTSPECSGKNVNPILHENYNGQDIALPAEPSKVIRVEENPDLKGLVGGTIITTDGTTLLGSDDKSGVAIMMALAEHLGQNPDIPHGPIRFVFTCDEEIGRGIEHLDLDDVGAVCGYTLDSDGRGRVDTETFSADQAVVTVDGINTHPSVGKDAMVNAIRILGRFLAELPGDHLAPEVSEGRDGFIHPYHVEGGVAKASARLILRDFETENLIKQAELLEQIAEPLRREFPKANIQIEIKNQYRNMRDGLEKEPRAVEKAIAATQAAGLKLRLDVIRGGTDGSLLTVAGLPTPNISSGQHNPHCPLEWTSLEELEDCLKVVIELCKQWSEERV
ncbi:MAG: peptidase T [Planctomycetaceae bacterium]|nr:peptidase T [Planctomycetaceae bacterium]